MARYGEAFRNRAVARLLPPESAQVGVVSQEIGVSVQTLERWREDAQSRPARGRAWAVRARLGAGGGAAAPGPGGAALLLPVRSTRSGDHYGGDGRGRQERLVS